MFPVIGEQQPSRDRSFVTRALDLLQQFASTRSLSVFTGKLGFNPPSSTGESPEMCCAGRLEKTVNVTQRAKL